ncbi:MAG TPA: hypothetical protein EYQ64_09300, partial [Gemmatimonadetes bacterium]|nr:hypothetical protein [Gemmatimonadota bacterium]
MTLMDSRRLSAAGLMLLIGFAPPIEAVAQSESAGLEIGGLPTLNFDADEGFGYGALLELYQYGQSGLRPYVWSLRPTVFLTSGGRRDFTVFLDAPHVLSAGWRLDAYLGSEKQIATPYYGIGNATPYDETRDDAEGPDPFYYRFGRTRQSAKFNLQRDVGETPLRWLVGAGLVRTSVLPVPDNEGSTLFETEIGARESKDWSNYLRAGLVWDSRDRETGPRSGAWTELLVQRVDESFGADSNYTRWIVAMSPSVIGLCSRTATCCRASVKACRSTTSSRCRRRSGNRKGWEVRRPSAVSSRTGSWGGACSFGMRSCGGGRPTFSSSAGR